MLVEFDNRGNSIDCSSYKHVIERTRSLLDEDVKDAEGHKSVDVKAPVSVHLPSGLGCLRGTLLYARDELKRLLEQVLLVA